MSDATKLYVGTAKIEHFIRQKISIKEIKLSADRAALEILFQRYAEELEQVRILRLDLDRLKVIH